MLSTWGHLHDGGMYTTLYVGGKPVCRSDSFYGTKDRYIEKPGVPNLSSKAQMSAMDNMKDGKMPAGMDMGSANKPTGLPPASSSGMQGMDMGSARQGSGAGKGAEVEEEDEGRRKLCFHCTDETADSQMLGRRTSNAQPQESSLQHITDVSDCTNFGILHPGDMVEVRAVYNTTRHQLNRAMHMGWEGIISWLATAQDNQFA